MNEAMTSEPRRIWPELSNWEPVGMEEPVYRARTTGGPVYVRPDDGSSAILAQLAHGQRVPVPQVLDMRQGWLLLNALPGLPLHHPIWRTRPDEVAGIIADALRRLQEVRVTHGDLCLPNILGDPETGRLSGVVDWRYAERYGPEIDVAAAVWSCGFNGYSDDVTLGVLRGCRWSRVDPGEVARLREVWTSLPGPPDCT